MTSIVGVICNDGVVIGTDSSATSVSAGGFKTSEHRTTKIRVIGEQVIVAGTGSVGLGQRFCAVVESLLGKGAFDRSGIEVGKALSATGQQDFHNTFHPPGAYGALVAYRAADGLHLCELAIGDFQPEQKYGDQIWYCSMGSAQPITDPFLGFIRGVFWENGMPNVHEGTFAVTWTLQHAIDFNPGGVNGPIQVAILQIVDGASIARILPDSELDQHQQQISEAIQHLRSLRTELRDIDSPDVPDVPRPQAGTPNLGEGVSLA